MAFLVDTNLLLRSVDLTHPMYSNATNAVNLLSSRGEQVCIVPQNLIEFWNVYTRPVNKHQITHILTFNVSDFTRYQEIIGIHPTQV